MQLDDVIISYIMIQILTRIILSFLICSIIIEFPRLIEFVVVVWDMKHSNWEWLSNNVKLALNYSPISSTITTLQTNQKYHANTFHTWDISELNIFIIIQQPTYRSTSSPHHTPNTHTPARVVTDYDCWVHNVLYCLDEDRNREHSSSTDDVQSFIGRHSFQMSQSNTTSSSISLLLLWSSTFHYIHPLYEHTN
jgi:hypothetical protein